MADRSSSKGVYRNGTSVLAGTMPVIVAVVALGVTLLTTLGGFATFRDYVSISVFTEYKNTVHQHNAAISERYVRLQRQVDVIEDEQKKRASNGAILAALEQRMNALSARINETERKFSGTYSVGDEIRRMQYEIQVLRQQLTTSRPPMTTFPPTPSIQPLEPVQPSMR